MLTQQKAFQIAKQGAFAHRLPWDDRCVDAELDDEYPINDSHLGPAWTFRTNADKLGGNLSVVVDVETGKLLDINFSNR